MRQFNQNIAAREEREKEDDKLLLGLQYMVGDGVQKNYQKGVKIFRELAEKGNIRGQYSLGVAYERGEGVAQNYEEAVKWYRKSAQQGNVDAGKTLGILYSTGRGVVKNHDEAVKWYKKAAINGDQFSMYSLGFLYSMGFGVPQSYKESGYWYNKAISDNTNPELSSAAREQLILNEESIKLENSKKKAKFNSVLLEAFEKKQDKELQQAPLIKTPSRTYCYRIGNAMTCTDR